MNKKKHYLLRPEPLFWKKGQKTNFYMEDFLGVFFGNYWDPNEHNPAGFALVAVISFIGCFWPFVASSIRITQSTAPRTPKLDPII